MARTRGIYEVHIHTAPWVGKGEGTCLKHGLEMTWWRDEPVSDLLSIMNYVGLKSRLL